MNIKKILCICFGALLISACAVKDYSPDSFKNYTAKQILKGGENAMAKRDFSEATRYFEAIDALYPFDPEAEKGQLDAIYAYYKAEDYASALAAASRYIHLYPEGEHTDYVYYMKGIVSFDKDRTFLQKLYPRKVESLDVSNLREAFFDFNELIKRFPHSVYAKDAEKRMLYIRNLLAERDFSIAKFYFDRKAYVAAANRASYVVQHFAGSYQVKDALRIMIKSYQALGLDKQADDAMRVFELNFPKEHI
jgi:outer membrane protein assembly factor BamD